MHNISTDESRLRPMSPDDLSFVLEWRNNASIRNKMFSKHEITFDTHSAWFEIASKDTNKHILIFEIDKKPMGYINFETNPFENIANWGFYKAPGAPKGTGMQLGKKALLYGFLKLKLNKVYGETLEQNQESIRMHKALGFKLENIFINKYFDDKQKNQRVFVFGLSRLEWNELNYF